MAINTCDNRSDNKRKKREEADIVESFSRICEALGFDLNGTRFSSLIPGTFYRYWVVRYMREEMGIGLDSMVLSLTIKRDTYYRAKSIHGISKLQERRYQNIRTRLNNLRFNEAISRATNTGRSTNLCRESLS